MDPRGILDLTGLVEVEDEVVGEHIAGIVGNHHRTPGGLTGCLHTSLQTSGIGGEVTHEGERLRQGPGRRFGVGGISIAATHELLGEVLGLGVDEFEVHRGIVLTGGLVDVDIQTVGTLHLEGGLHACW